MVQCTWSPHPLTRSRLLLFAPLAVSCSAEANSFSLDFLCNGMALVKSRASHSSASVAMLEDAEAAEIGAVDDNNMGMNSGGE